MEESPVQQQEGQSFGQMLTFHLGGETYGVDILRVKEIRGWSPVTRIPQSPPHVLGVLNLRGAVVPIIDLRMRFALASADFSPTTVIIVVSVSDGEGRRECGVVVDSVSDVSDVASEDVRSPPSMGNEGLSGCITGLVTTEDRMVILLSVDELIAQDLATASVDEAA